MREDGTLDEGPVTEVKPPSDPEAVRRLTIVEQQDPDLDRDLARWSAEGTPDVPLVGILGEPLVRAPGQYPSVRPSWFTEVLVYLSLHPLGVTMQTAVTDLWPDGQNTCRVMQDVQGVHPRWSPIGPQMIIWRDDGGPLLSTVAQR